MTDLEIECDRVDAENVFWEHQEERNPEFKFKSKLESELHEIKREVFGGDPRVLFSSGGISHENLMDTLRYKLSFEHLYNKRRNTCT